jgi:hypothetical protein
MVWMFILWLNILTGLGGLQSQTITKNPLEGYTIQITQQSQTPDEKNNALMDSEEDSEDADDEPDSALIDKGFTSSSKPIIPLFPLHMHEYNDLISQAYLTPILTPPDTNSSH